MKILTPLKVTPSNLLSTNVPETDHPLWVSGTTYSEGNRVIYSHDIYVRLVTGGGTVPPPNDPTNWQKVSATNAWKMFDDKGGSQTTNPSSIVVSIIPSTVVNSVALLLLDASFVRVKMINGVDIVYDKTVSLTSLVNDMWEWFHLPISKQETLLFTDLPSYANATIEITITNSTTTAKVGSCLLGLFQQYGDVQYGASAGIQSYSLKQKDSFGNITIIPRGYNDTVRFSIRLKPNTTDSFKQALTKLRDTPALYIGSDMYQSLSVYGFYKDFDIVMSSYAYTDCSLEVEGLV